MNGYEWMTHAPLVRAVMDIYHPRFVLECGVGDYSTPIFIEYGVKYKGIDTSITWTENFIEKYDLNILYQDIGDIACKLNYRKITPEQSAEIQEFYEGVRISKLKPNLLFVDQDACCRLISINVLSPKFDIIIYHDHDEAGFEDNSYDLINDYGFVRYALTTERTGAGVMIRQEMDKGFNALNDAIQPYIKQFTEGLTDCKWMKFDRYE